MQTWEEKLARECGLTAQASQCRKMNPNPKLVWQEVYQSIGRGSKANYPFLKRKKVKSAGPGAGAGIQALGDEICCEEGGPAFTFSAFHGLLEPQFSEEPSWQLPPRGLWHLPSAQVWPIGEMKRKQPLLLSAASQQGCGFSRETPQIWPLRRA